MNGLTKRQSRNLSTSLSAKFGSQSKYYESWKLLSETAALPSILNTATLFSSCHLMTETRLSRRRY